MDADLRYAPVTGFKRKRPAGGIHSTSLARCIALALLQTVSASIVANAAEAPSFLDDYSQFPESVACGLQ